jgi:hypothetical protein
VLVLFGQVAQQRRHILRRPDVAQRQRQELVLRPAAVQHRGLVDGQETQRLGIEDPHRQRVALKQQRGVEPMLAPGCLFLACDH